LKGWPHARLLLAIGSVVAVCIWISLSLVTRDVVGQPAPIILALVFGGIAGFTISELALRSERDLLSRILRGMQEGVLLLDRDGRVALMNPALREMFLVRAEILGQPLLDVVKHEALGEVLERARNERGTVSGEIELDGLQPRRLLVRSSTLDEQGGGTLAVFFDVTDVRRLESLRRDFVANVSHELRTPVTAIISAAETLESAATKDPKTAKRFVDIIQRNASRLKRLIEDLLDLSRIESRELKLNPERIEFAPFAAQLLGMFRERAEQKKITLRLDCARDAETEADRRALEQVLTNLVENAVKYCPSGSRVIVRGERAHGSLRFRVEDDGPGIEEKHLPRLFERFYRVDTGRSREMGGTGLGLSIVKHLVEAMDGTIEVRSTVGKGTTFEVLLPERRHSTKPPPSVEPTSIGP
jgi:two-component system phosphate regulon sensor histidine kinase PhoR